MCIIIEEMNNNSYLSILNVVNQQCSDQRPARARSMPFISKEMALQHFQNVDNRKPSSHITEGVGRTLKSSCYSFQQCTVTVKIKP